MITVDQLKAKIKRDLTSYVPSGTPVSTNVKENMLLMLEVLGGGGGGGSAAPTPATYAELKAHIIAGTLVPGQKYLFTDFQTKHYIVNISGTQDLTAVVTGPVEPLILTAVSTTQFHAQAISLLHPADIVYIDVDPLNWLQDNAFADINLGPTPEIIIPGWKGTITFRHDTIYDISAGYDWRYCKSRRYKFPYADYDPASATYGNGSMAFNGDDLWLAPGSPVPAGSMGDPNYWIKVASRAVTPYLNASVYNAADFVEVPLFAQLPGATKDYTELVRNVHQASFKDEIAQWASTGSILTNNVFWLQDDTWYNYIGVKFGPESGFNTFAVKGTEAVTAGAYCYNNTFTGTLYLSRVTLGEYYLRNMASNMQDCAFTLYTQSCHFGDGFKDNTALQKLDNVKFGNNVVNNTFNGVINGQAGVMASWIKGGAHHNQFGPMYKTFIGPNLADCVFTGELNNVTIGSDMFSCQFHGGMTSVTIGNNCYFLNFHGEIGRSGPVTIADACIGVSVHGVVQNGDLNPVTAPRVFTLNTIHKTLHDQGVGNINTYMLSYVNSSGLVVVAIATP